MATLRKRWNEAGTSWWRELNWREAGRQYRRSLGQIPKKEASIVLQSKQLELSSGKRILPTGLLNAGPLFSHFSEDYLDWYATEYPHSCYRVAQVIKQWLVPRFGAIRLAALNKCDVEQYKADRLAIAKAATVTKELHVLQAILNRAVEWEVITLNPIRGIRAPRDPNSKPPRWYNATELNGIYAASTDHRHCIWRLMANTGLRRSESLQLQWRDIGEDAIRIVSADVARTKSGKWREIPINDSARCALEELPRDGRHVIPQINAVSLSRSFANTLRRANLDGSIHCLRHTHCSHLAMAGIPLRTIQKLAGHAHFKTTERYAHLAPDHLQDAAKAINL